jgi:hypothetical protein
MNSNSVAALTGVRLVGAAYLSSVFPPHRASESPAPRQQYLPPTPASNHVH